MPAVVTATVSTPEMIRGGEDHQSIGGKIIVPGHHRQRAGRGLFAVEGHHTAAAEAGSIARFDRHAGEQFGGNVD